MSDSHTYASVVALLLRTRRRLFWRVAAQRFCRLLTIAVVLLLTVGLAEQQWLFSGQIRAALSGGLAMVMATVAAVLFRQWWIVGRRYRGRSGLEVLALEAGQMHSDVRDRLGNALAVVHRLPENPLAERALKQAWAQEKAWLFSDWVRRIRLVPDMRLTVGAMLVFAVLCLFPGAMLPAAFWRLAHPAVDTPPPFSLNLQIDRAWVVRGDSLRMAVHTAGASPSVVYLESITGEKATVRTALHRPFQMALRATDHPLRLRAVSGRVKTEWDTVAVVERPLLRSLRLTVTPPAYTRQPSTKLAENQGHVDLLPGSRLSVDVQASKPLSEAGVVLKGGRRIALNVDSSHASGGWRVHSAGVYHMALIDTLGLENTQPIDYRIQLRHDLAPTARILSPAASLDLDENMTVPLSLLAQDDFGFSRLRLGYALLQAGHGDSLSARYLPLKADSVSGRSQFVRLVWPVDTLGLLPGDAVSFFFEAWDNDAVSGAKLGRSRVLTARFPSMDEIFADLAGQQSTVQEAVEALIDEGREISRDVGQLAEKLRTGQALSWEEQQKLESAVTRQEALKREGQALGEKLEQAAESLDERQMADLETLEKFKQIQVIFKSMDDPALKEAAERLRKAMDDGDNAALEAAMAQMAMDQKALDEALDRTLNLLKRAALEQRLEGLTRQVEQLAVDQERLNATAQAEEAARQAQAQKGGIRAAEREMTDLAKAMQATAQTPSDAMEKALSAQQQREIPAEIDRQTAALRSGQPQSSREAGQEAMAGLTQWRDDLKALAVQMAGQQNQRLNAALSRYQQRLMQLSQAQEQLTEAASQRRISGAAAAEQQQALSQSLAQLTDSLMALSREAFFMPPEMAQAMGRGKGAMDRAVQQMGQSGQPVPSLMGQALGELNRALLTLEGMGGGSSGQGGAMQQLMAGLEGMTREQQAIQRQTLDMLNQGAMSPAQQAQARRLGGTQRALQQRLEEMMRALGGQSALEGRLDALTQEMAAVARDLEAARAGRETVQREQRIISRLLEAQHAAREQDRSRRRQARSARDVIRRSPPARSRSEVTGPSWRDQLLRLEKEGYSADYQKLIRRYFEALMRASASEKGERP